MTTTPAHSPRLRARQALIYSAVAALFVALLWLVWQTLPLLLLGFGGILLAVLLRAPTDWLSRHTPLSAGWALTLVLLALVVLVLLLALLTAPTLAEQLDDLGQSLSQSLTQLRQTLGQYVWGQRLLSALPDLDQMAPQAQAVLTEAYGMLSGLLGALVNLLLLVFIGIYLAAQPALYRNGVIRLVPPRRRARAIEVLDTLGRALKWWLLGQLFSMTVLGTLTGVGLWLLGIQPALALGVLAGLFSFVPYIGPILGIIPALLIAFTDGPQTVLYVALLYLAIQTVESYLLTPLVQQRAVSMPPVLALFAQLLLGSLAGALGVATAFPLTVVLMVLVQMLYIQDTLGDPVTVSGEET